ncbi:MAG: hypothetical protein HY543_01880 [Deltaproteobacteria bacterium]|nr:hypothetical protein [Deltaproteobacteria bacterium]
MTVRGLLMTIGCLLIAAKDLDARAERPAAALRGVTPAMVERVLAAAPPLLLLQRRVMATAGLAPGDEEAWARRARRAAWLPRLQVGFRHDLTDTLDLSSKDSVSVSGSGVVIGPRASDLVAQSDRRLLFDVAAVWSLPELLFTTDSLAVSREGRERRAEGRELLRLATQLFSDYVRCRAVLECPGGCGARDPAAIRVRQMEAVGQLDALTAGWFSEAIR